MGLVNQLYFWPNPFECLDPLTAFWFRSQLWTWHLCVWPPLIIEIQSWVGFSENRVYLIHGVTLTLALAGTASLLSKVLILIMPCLRMNTSNQLCLPPLYNRVSVIHPCVMVEAANLLCLWEWYLSEHTASIQIWSLSYKSLTSLLEIYSCCLNSCTPIMGAMIE